MLCRRRAHPARTGALAVVAAVALAAPAVADGRPARAKPRVPAALPDAVVSASFWNYTSGHGAEWCAGNAPRSGVKPACLPEVRVLEGQGLVFHNADTIGHDLRSYELDRDDQPRFDSGIVRRGKQARVEGVGSLSPGDYHFFCTVHPARADGGGMHGILIVRKAS